MRRRRGTSTTVSQQARRTGQSASDRARTESVVSSGSEIKDTKPPVNGMSPTPNVPCRPVSLPSAAESHRPAAEKMPTPGMLEENQVDQSLSSPRLVFTRREKIINFIFFTIVILLTLDVLFFIGLNQNGSPDAFPLGGGLIQLLRICQRHLPRVKVNLLAVTMEALVVVGAVTWWHSSELNFFRRQRHEQDPPRIFVVPPQLQDPGG
jgi:hypothetical protein